jgi:predicted histone-like DNA-binding protein
MPVPFSVKSRVDLNDPKRSLKYYPVVRSRGEVDIRRLADEIAQGTSLSRPDVLATLEALVLVIPKHMAEGYIVRLGELGSLRLSLQAEGSDTPEEVNAKNIKGAKYIFRPGPELKDSLDTLSFVKVKDA